MSQTALEGNVVNVCGAMPEVGSRAADFVLTKTDLSEAALSEFEGKKVVLNIFPSIDTPVCAASVRTFNKDAASKEDVVVLCISMDLPFALGRFCGGEGLDDVISLSAFRSPSFAEDYGVGIVDSPLRGLLARAVVVLDTDGKVVYTELVPEITTEPNYAAALQAL